jgi:hypothetical protein
MSFKENLLAKIEINRLAARVIASIGPVESGSKVDKEAMRSLLEMSPYQNQKARDLDLYVEEIAQEHKKILVLDNELPIYKTTIDDVAMRKSPLIKEMANIRNIIKILKDSDVKLSRKAESVKAIQSECIDQLDLSFKPSDIEEIAKDGAVSLESGYAEGVTESLVLLAELLGYQPPPKVFRARHHEILGALSKKDAGEILYGPIVIFSLSGNSLKLINDQISNYDKPKLEFFQQVIQGNQAADIDGKDVFLRLKNAALKKNVLPEGLLQKLPDS